MNERNILITIRKLRRSVFSTAEITAASGKSASAAVQMLSRLERSGFIFKVCRGVWADSAGNRVSPYGVVPFLAPRHRLYVSFLSALHLHGIIEQIPQVVTVAATIHTKTMRTRLGTFSIHKISPDFFKGFDWYRKTGDFLIAEPEKALVDCLYLSARRKNQFRHFPELHFPETFDFNKARWWAKNIHSSKTRCYVLNRLDKILKR